MPVCITGMHRSGTSLVANLLRLCGLYLGEEHNLLPATADNTEGYWENRKFVLLNDEILRELGGSWDFPPMAAVNGWVYEGRFNSVRIKTEALLEDFKGREPWGWKDPRTCLTIEFWKSLDGIAVPFWLGRAPRLKVVLCVRDPIEVFRSLRDRRFTPSSAGLDLWSTYNRSILNGTLPDERIITHYEAYFANPINELRRVLEFLDIPASNQTIEVSTGVISKKMRRQCSSTTIVNGMDLDQDVIDLYASMCEEAKYLRAANQSIQ